MIETISKTEADINYFKSYKKELNNFLNAESLNLTVKKYMEIVIETQTVETYISKLKNKIVK
jgi:hypothetical protein